LHRRGRRIRFYIEDDWYIEPAEPWRMDMLVEDDQPEDTGLLDADGNPIFCASERIPMGFDLSGGANDED
jgi:hypothetical protein